MPVDSMPQASAAAGNGPTTPPVAAKLGKELGPQAVSLLVRTGGGPIQSLQQKYFTPGEAGVPTHKSVKIVHRPILIKPPDPPPGDQVVLSPPPVVNEKNTLDGFLLLQATGMTLPSDGRTASLPEKKLKAVIAEDLTFFENLLYLDVSENSLPLEPFGVLPSLEELRIACNNIYEVGDIPGNYFEHLLRLDLSYNSLTLRSVQVLDSMPCLVELDLCGNNLRGLPLDMFRFPCLEKILLDHNKIDDNGVLVTLCCMSKLRHCSLAYNFLSNVPSECCGEGFFRLLEYIDLSFNYFGAERNVQSLVDLPRLNTVVLYGNPLLGPTGEDPLQTYIEDLVNTAIDLRVLQNKKEIEFITEVPRQRILKKGMPSGRQATYRDFEVVAIDEGVTKPTREWRAEGKKTMFAEAVAAARLKIDGSIGGSSVVGGVGGAGGVGGGGEKDFTFLTGTGSVVSHDTSYKSAKLATAAASSAHALDAIAEDIMGKVAVELGIGQATSAELLMLRDKIVLQPSMVSRMDNNNNYNDEEEEVADRGRRKEDKRESKGLDFEDYDEAEQMASAAAVAPTTDTLPRTLFSEAFANNETNEPKLSGHPVPLTTAVAALKFAVRNPITNYDEVPAKGFLPPKNYVQPTAASRNRRLPRREAKATGGGDAAADSDHVVDIKGKVQRGLPEPLDARKNRDIHRQETLEQIEEVIDGLNTNTDHFIRKKGEKKAAEEFEAMNYFARPNTGLSNLLTMVDEVIADLDDN